MPFSSVGSQTKDFVGFHLKWSLAPKFWKAMCSLIQGIVSLDAADYCSPAKVRTARLTAPLSPHTQNLSHENMQPHYSFLFSWENEDGGGARSWGKCGVRPTLLKRSPQISVGQTFWGLIFCLLFQNTLKTNLQVYFS